MASVGGDLTAAVVAVLVVMGTAAMITRRTGKAAYVDAAWGASFVAAGVAAFLSATAQGGSGSWHAWLLLALVSIWGTRLTWDLARRVRLAEHDDPRYEDYLGGSIANVPFHLVVMKVFGLQAALVVAVAVPVVVGLTRRDAATGLVLLGAVLWLVGILFEAVADAQLEAFRSQRDRPPLLTTGLWAWSRHPNYFGDFCVWWGFWLIGGAAGGVTPALATLFAPLLMSWILIGVSGVRLAERRMQGRPGWEAYCAATPVFVPWRFVGTLPSNKGIRPE
jgi:steroid 5-alpha reductase family enzyme